MTVRKVIFFFAWAFSLTHAQLGWGIPIPKEVCGHPFSKYSHVRELLGDDFRDRVTLFAEKDVDFDLLVHQWTQKALVKKWKKDSDKISSAILSQSTRYGLDPVFILAVIENESSFNPEVTGSFGEIGLMQVLPGTATWISQKFGLDWDGNKSLLDPVVNIRIGTAYLSYLREKFGFHSQLYISAYNMGSKNVHKALERNVWPKTYSSRVLRRYIRIYSDLQKATYLSRVSTVQGPG